MNIARIGQTWINCHWLSSTVYHMLCVPFQAEFSELLGLKDYMGIMYFITLAESTVPVSDENVMVTEEKFDGVEVVLYQPKQRGSNSELRRAVIYLHGGGWCLGSASKLTCWIVFTFILQNDFPGQMKRAQWIKTRILGCFII